MDEVTQYSDLLNKTFTKVYQQDDDELYFEREDGKVFRFFHYQSCCESVTIESIDGDLKDLENSELVEAEAVSRFDETDDGTWTFYKFRTSKGNVTVRWFSPSNYYSDSVDFEEVGSSSQYY